MDQLVHNLKIQTDNGECDGLGCSAAGLVSVRARVDAGISRRSRLDEDNSAIICTERSAVLRPTDCRLVTPVATINDTELCHRCSAVTSDVSR